MGYMVAMISSFYNAQVVFIAFAITVLSCGAIVLFAMQTKVRMSYQTYYLILVKYRCFFQYDFTGCIAVMAVLGFVLLFAAIGGIVVALVSPKGFYVSI